MKHKHHIIPKHMGGSDDPSNLVEVTIEQHAELHRQLWEDLGHQEDYIAWQCLSGQITTAEAIILAVKKANTGRKMVFTDEHKRNLSISRKKQAPPRLGMKASEETKKKMSEAQKKRFQNENERSRAIENLKKANEIRWSK